MQGARDLGKALGGPALRAPTGAGTYQAELGCGKLIQQLTRPGITAGVARQLEVKAWLGAGRGGHSLCVERAGGSLDGARNPDAPRSTRELRCCRRPNGALKIESQLPALAAELVKQPEKFPARAPREGPLPPLASVHNMQHIHQGAFRPPGPRGELRRAAQQAGPALFQDPADERARKTPPQRANGRQSVHNVTHRAQADDKYLFWICGQVLRIASPGPLMMLGSRRNGRDRFHLNALPSWNGACVWAWPACPQVC